MRFVVIGTSGAGKSTLARRLAEARQLPYIELDSLFWAPNWKPRPPEWFAQAVAEAIDCDRWVVDGNYSSVRSILWPMATDIVWLDFGRFTVFSRMIWHRLTSPAQARAFLDAQRGGV